MRLRGVGMPFQHSWQVLAILSALMGFASISTDLYLPTMSAVSASLAAKPGQIELSVSTFSQPFCNAVNSPV
jgi:MFS transporter, DHA1 family, multidrug resistance protein